MSAFVVSNETMHRVVAAFVHFNQFPDALASDIGKMLFEMNHTAMLTRYGETDENGTYTYVERNPSIGQMFKATECLLYQCSEGAGPETGLYKLTEAISDACAHELTGLDDRDKAKKRAWDLTGSEPWDYHE